MIRKYWVQSQNYHIRLPDGTVMNLNSPKGCDFVFDFYEYIGELEARLKKRESRHSKKQQQPKQELGDE